MTAADFATAGFINDWFRALDAKLEALQHTAAQPGGAAELLSIEDVMARLNCSRSSVQRWIKTGKRGRLGGIVKLQVLWFSTSEPRIPAPALLAFGQGLAFDLSTIQGLAPRAVPVPPALEPDPSSLRRVA